MRQFPEVPPWLATSNTPAVSATTGLGTGGGAAVQTPDSGGFGDVLVYPGKGAAAGGTVALTFPSTPPTLFIGADQEFGPVTQNTVGNVVTLTWTASNFPSPSGQTAYRLHYEWSASF